MKMWKDLDWELTKANGDPTTVKSEASCIRVWIDRERFRFIDIELFDRHYDGSLVVRSSGVVAVHPEATNCFNIKLSSRTK